MTKKFALFFRMVYELAYRTIQMLIPETQFLYSCCPGWKQTQLYATDCKAGTLHSKQFLKYDKIQDVKNLSVQF